MTYYKTDLTHPYLNQMVDYPDIPKKLWVRGKLPDCASGRPKTVAIVGARRCTGYGEDAAYRLANQLAAHGVIIVSGLAYGIDSCAHRGCLDAGGITIAVLGTAIDQIYPRSNLDLAERILEKGAIISEHNPGEEAKNYFFLYRNRIVSGLADVVVVIEAAERSGTLFTAYVAEVEQSKIVFAMPGDITRPMSIGCNNLIKNGCIPYTKVEDVLDELKIKSKAKKDDYSDCDLSERRVLKCIKDGKQDNLNIVAETKLSVGELAQILTSLEMKNHIKPIGIDHWALA